MHTSEVMNVENISVAGYGHELLQSITLPFSLPTPVYGAMLAIWHLRPILQKRFPLHKGKVKDFVRFIAWCSADGRRQYAILRAISEWDEALTQPISLPNLRGDQWHNGFSVAMFLYGIARYRYTFGAMLHSTSARHRVARAYLRGERHLREQPALPSWQLEYLLNRYANVDAMLEVLRIKSKDHGKSPQQLDREFGLQDIFQHVRNPSSNNEFPSLERVTLPPIRTSIPFRLPLWLIRNLTLSLEQLCVPPNEFEKSSVTSRIPLGIKALPQIRYPFGVNLFGYAKGELGIGEDVRLLALALKAQNIPFCIINVKPGDNVSQHDSSVDHWIVDKPRYAINIFCATGIENVRIACEQGLDAFEGRYNIGLWPWELPNWPASCSYTYSVIDEVWGISRYTANAYRHAPRPVFPMSLPVTVDNIADLARVDFGLPENEYLYIFSFDFNSTLSRKNPLAVIDAFQMAFPLGSQEKVGLVLKASHVNDKNGLWKRVKSILDADSRIHFMGETLRRPQLLALYRNCDCYVSLHRAEGFGRSLAEALLLDMQLVTTEYSGNLDFCHAERVALVRNTITNLKNDDYFYAEGQYWAEPDVEHASQMMRQVYHQPMKSSRSMDFSPETVGRYYAHRLYKIKQKLELMEEEIITC